MCAGPCCAMLSNVRFRNSTLALILLICFAGAGTAQEARELKVGLALSGGAALGFAHLGVILELEKAGVPVHCIAGTSMGSIIGALYATGYSGEEMLELVERTDWNELFTDTPPRRGKSYKERRADKAYLAGIGFSSGGLMLGSGVSAGQNVVVLLDQLMRRYAAAGSFDRFPRPLRVVATDLVSGEEVVFADGDLKSSVRASIAVPGLFTPLLYRDRLLIDGGWVNVLPVDSTREMGADFVIAVNVRTMSVDEDEFDSMTEVLRQSSLILRRPRLKKNLSEADLVIEPDVSQFNPASFDRALALVEEGRKAARAALPELLALAERARPFAAPAPDPASDVSLFIENVSYSAARLEPVIHTELVGRLAGETSVSLIQDEIDALYRTGIFEYVSYELLPREKGVELVLQLVPHEEPKTVIRGGYSFRTEALGGVSPRLMLLSNLTVNGLTGSGSSWSTDLRLSDVGSIRSEYEQALFRPVSLTGSLYALSEPMPYYREERVESTYLYSRYGGSIGVRTRLFEAMELTASGLVHWMEHSLREGSDLGLDAGETEIGLSAVGVVDNLDRYPFPRRGNETLLVYEYRYQAENLRSYHSARLSQRYHFPLPGESSFDIGYRFTSDLNTDSPPHARSFLGGLTTFSGLHERELIGRHTALLTGGLTIALFSLPLGIGDTVYLGISGEVGNAWNESPDMIIEDPRLVAGGGIGISAETIFGELHVRFGVAAGEEIGGNPLRYALHIALGNPIEAAGIP